MCKWNDTVPVMFNYPEATAQHVAGKVIEDIDRCIAPLIVALRDAGIETIESCCGHGNARGSVILADGRWLVIFTDRNEALAAQVIDAPSKLAQLLAQRAMVVRERDQLADELSSLRAARDEARAELTKAREAITELIAAQIAYRKSPFLLKHSETVRCARAYIAMLPFAMDAVNAKQLRPWLDRAIEENEPAPPRAGGGE